MSKRLLVVEDEPHPLRAVAACLRAEGYEVVTARGGSEALVRVAERTPDLVVSDIRMPGMDGYQLARQLRSAPRTALIPVVFLTAKDELSDRVEGFRAGVDAYLTKPFEPDELVAVVSNILARGLSNKEIAAEFEISVRTVENHISHILDKKNFNNRVEITRYVLSQSGKT